MNEFIDAVADLTDLREQDDMETAFARLLFDQLDAVECRLWRVVHRRGETFLRWRVGLPEGTREGTQEELGESPDLPLDHAPEPLQICYETKTDCRMSVAGGLFGHVFALCDGRNVIGLIEVLRYAPLAASQTRMIRSLLRIYRNHLGILAFSDRDELTGLLNRRTFNDTFKRVAQRVATNALLGPSRSKRPYIAAQVQLAVIDIDFFKSINDRFGHPYGDEVLVLLARLMVECFRDSDRLFRFGGEEFLAILPDTTPDEAELALERFRASVEAFRFSQLDRVTVSIGFTHIKPEDSSATAFGRADQALYVAKNRGRNQVRCYELLLADGTLASATGNEQEVELF